MPAGEPPFSEPERRVFTLPDGASMAFRKIPAGKFRMGSRGNGVEEEPVHEVCIPDPYWLAETPVTQEQFGVWVAAQRVNHEGFVNNPPRSENPAENVLWTEAIGFCAWLANSVLEAPKNKLPEGYSLFCLPTEAEWEYACRAGTETAYHTGDGEAALAEAGWFVKNSEGLTHPVRQKQPNGFGLYDMHGNVWEWCHNSLGRVEHRFDVDGDTDSGRPMRAAEWAAGPPIDRLRSGIRARVLRGGSYLDIAKDCRSAFRYGYGPIGRFGFSGFRVCLVRDPEAQRPIFGGSAP